jgi:tRNA U34 5-methylaminomethyl-2-thiouridine-forming methyltransferase MnmC
MKAEIIITEDGSHSLHITELGEGYHSIHGAIQESNHVYINAGFKKACPLDTEINNELTILEIGLGTGLNVLLTLIESENTSAKINYIAIEPYPIEIGIVKELNYAHLLKDETLTTILQRIHTSEWEVSTKLSNNFTFCKKLSKNGST